MYKAVAVAVAVVAVSSGCGGGGNFPGAYFGEIKGPIECSDGSSNVDSATIEWAVTQSGDTLTLGSDSKEAVCVPLTARVSDDEALILAKECTKYTVADGSITVEPTITGGKLSMSGDAMDVELKMTSVLSRGPQTIGCKETVTGTLKRRQK